MHALSLIDPLPEDLQTVAPAVLDRAITSLMVPLVTRFVLLTAVAISTRESLAPDPMLKAPPPALPSVITGRGWPAWPCTSSATGVTVPVRPRSPAVSE
jgi:hypothetical protein